MLKKRHNLLPLLGKNLKKMIVFFAGIILIYLHKSLCNEKIYQIYGNCHAFGRNHRPK